MEDGTWIEDEEQTLKIKANFVISAFGSSLTDNDGKEQLLCSVMETMILQSVPIFTVFGVSVHSFVLLVLF